MAGSADNTLKLVIEADANQANKSVDQFNRGLSNVEKTAAQSGQGASRGIDGVTASMVKGATAGNLLADAIKHTIEWVKAWAIEAVQHAAHTDKMAMSMNSLARAHDVSAAAANRAVEEVKKVGFGTQDAIHAVDRLVIADIGLEKAQGLAKIAKDAAAIENITPAEAIEKLLMAVESGASRGLRTMGMFVDLNKEVERQEKLTGKTLNEKEVIQLRLNAVEREAAKIQGAAAAAAGSAEAQFSALRRETNELKEAVGQEFQQQFVEIARHLRSLIGFAKDNSTAFVKLGEAALALSAALTAAALIAKMGAIAKSASMALLPLGTLRTVLYAISEGLTGALVGTEVVLLAILRLVPIVGAGILGWYAGGKLDEYARKHNKELDQTAEG
jgi:predicted  nucleic acid-binding Zn-ribbon protein